MFFFKTWCGQNHGVSRTRGNPWDIWPPGTIITKVVISTLPFKFGMHI